MGTKAVKKSILKPLRYISIMFDAKEPEMQIGGPTDVKHVAHIGWDGPNVGAPGWMKDYHSAPLNSTGEAEKESPVKNLWGSQEFMRVEDSPSIPEGPTSAPGSSSVENSVDDSIQVPSRARHARRHQSNGVASTDSSNHEPSDGSNRRKMRPRKKEVTNGPDLSGQDLPAIPKQSHRRRPKGAAGATRAKASTTLAAADAAYQENITNPQQKLDHTAEDEEDSE